MILLVVPPLQMLGWMDIVLSLRMTSPSLFNTRSRLPTLEAIQVTDEASLAGVYWENGLTCVEYEAADGELELGVYVKSTLLISQPHIRPLCASTYEDGVSALLCDLDAPAVPLSAVRTVLDADYVFVSERQAGGGQGLGNPHGEHGEECYDLRECFTLDEYSGLPPGVRLVVREGRDTERVL